MKTPFFYALLLAAGILALSQCADDRLYNTLTVLNGSGSGVFEAGDQVQIVADTPASGSGFFSWTGDTAYLSDPGAPIATLTMPLRNVELTATYKSLPTYQLTVENGQGSGKYLEGTRVTVSATLPPGNWVFVQWEGDLEFIKDEEDEVTQITMPAKPITIRATFEEANLVSFQRDIVPVFNTRCVICHDNNSNYYPYTNYNEIKTRAQEVRAAIENGTMPPNGMPQSEKDLIYLWMDQGLRNN
jgi:hypothetical protein